MAYFFYDAHQYPASAAAHTNGGAHSSRGLGFSFGECDADPCRAKSNITRLDSTVDDLMQRKKKNECSIADDDDGWHYHSPNRWCWPQPAALVVAVLLDSKEIYDVTNVEINLVDYTFVNHLFQLMIVLWIISASLSHSVSVSFCLPCGRAMSKMQRAAMMLVPHRESFDLVCRMVDRSWLLY